MQYLKDSQGRSIRLTSERHEHLELTHPEMAGQFERITETLAQPDRIVRSQTDRAVDLFYKEYRSTPVSRKFLCVIVKGATDDPFIITAYYTDTVKRGEILWEKK